MLMRWTMAAPESWDNNRCWRSCHHHSKCAGDLDDNGEKVAAGGVDDDGDSRNPHLARNRFVVG